MKYIKIISLGFALISTPIFSQWAGSSSNAGNTPIQQNTVTPTQSKINFGLGLTLYNTFGNVINQAILDDRSIDYPLNISSSKSSFEVALAFGNYSHANYGVYYAFNLGSSTLDFQGENPNTGSYIKGKFSIINYDYELGVGGRQVLQMGNSNGPGSINEGYMAIQYTGHVTFGFATGSFSSSYKNLDIDADSYMNLGASASLILGKHLDIGLRYTIPIIPAELTYAGTGGGSVIDLDDLKSFFSVKALAFF
jgi:hypothetical protein